MAAQTDVLIVGGGPAGLGAALGAARAGAEVILSEQYGFLGGSATAALVIPLVSYYTHHHHREKPGATTFFPTDHGRGDPVISGALAELVERLVRAGGALTPSSETAYTVPFDPEVFKAVALDMLDEAGVRILFHSFASDVFREESRVRGVVFETKSGPVVIKAKAIIDCTGDGDIAARAGAPYEVGREEDGLVQPMTLHFRMVDIGKAAFKAYVKKHPDQWMGVHGLWDLIQRAEKDGEIELPREDILFFGTPHEKELSFNCSRVIKVLGTDVWDLTYAEMESRKQNRKIAAFMKKYVPGFEKAYMVQSGTTVGVRESRRITGDYRISAEDILGAGKFDDAIARGTYPIDLHNPEGKGTVLVYLPPGESYDIPLRSLLPRGIDHLLMAGRCISGSHEAHSSYRVMPICMATGQAAGVCAALAARRARSPREMPAQDVQDELLRQGANLRRG
jgi:glycine/D-amino acid oxidase-like deaminating enzyme